MMEFLFCIFEQNEEYQLNWTLRSSVLKETPFLEPQ